MKKEFLFLKKRLFTEKETVYRKRRLLQREKRDCLQKKRLFTEKETFTKLKYNGLK